MSSIVQTIQNKTKTTLPISSSSLDQPGIRRRMSSLSLNLQPGKISTSRGATWAMQGSRSISNAGNWAKGWLEMGWTWIMSRKPTFVQDLEMNEEEKHSLGFHCKGTLRHLLFKLKKLIRSDDDHFRLPQSYRY